MQIDKFKAYLDSKRVQIIQDMKRLVDVPIASSHDNQIREMVMILTHLEDEIIFWQRIDQENFQEVVEDLKYEI